MPRTKSGDDRTHADSPKPAREGTARRSSPGRGEEVDDDEAADLQPGDVENGDTAR